MTLPSAETTDELLPCGLAPVDNILISDRFIPKDRKDRKAGGQELFFGFAAGGEDVGEEDLGEEEDLEEEEEEEEDGRLNGVGNEELEGESGEEADRHSEKGLDLKRKNGQLGDLLVSKKHRKVFGADMSLAFLVREGMDSSQR